MNKLIVTLMTATLLASPLMAAKNPPPSVPAPNVPAPNVPAPNVPPPNVPPPNVPLPVAPQPGMPFPDMSDTNKKVVISAIDAVFNQANYAVIPDYYSPSYADHSQPVAILPGFEVVKTKVSEFRTGFPDALYKVEEVIGAGDYVIVRGTIEGKNNGSFMGMPFIGASGSMEIIEIYRLSGGKIAERWAQSDLLGILRQVTPPGVNPLMFSGQTGLLPTVPAKSNTGSVQSGSALQTNPSAPDSTDKGVKHPTKPHKPTPPGPKSGNQGEKKQGSGGGTPGTGAN